MEHEARKGEGSRIRVLCLPVHLPLIYKYDIKIITHETSCIRVSQHWLECIDYLPLYVNQSPETSGMGIVTKVSLFLILIF